MLRASAIVRARNERSALQRALASLRGQTVGVEIIVVDSGSTDGALAVARRHADRLIEIPPGSFTFGGALNTGAEAASGDVHIALSSHCELPRADWVERALSHYADPQVAGTHGCRELPDKRLLAAALLQDADHARRHPYWGFSNHASSWRASVWEAFPFDPALPACEDKAWAHRVLAAGWRIAVDPELDVPKPHRRAGGVRALYARSVREGAALAQITDLPHRGVRDVARAWWREIPQDGRPALRHRLNYFRATEIAGRWTGERRGHG
jgi:rhamnosyltransferase